MRLLNSVCKIVADNNPNVPVHIMDVPQGFTRPCFLVTLATESTNLINLNVYEDNPIYQIVYFGLRNEADQGYPEGLYTMKESLKALFFLPGVFPVLTPEGEKQRYAHTENFTSEVRLAESAVYTKFQASFMETAREDPEAGLDPVGEVTYGEGVVINFGD